MDSLRLPSNPERSEAEISKADLHVHSKYSDQPSDWILRRVGAPECFTDPQLLYDRAKAAGMDFVTISDHNEIAGALELKAKYPDEIFVGQEITAYFPENGCKMHILAWDFTEEQHREIQAIRPNIHDLAVYLRRQDILHSVAHPFYQNNSRLTLDQFEKLILMFKHFEGLNGARDPVVNSLAVDVLRGLSPETVAHLADRHNLAPLIAEPHIKFFTGGSDDHSSVFIARAWTTVPRSKSCREFLQRARKGECSFAGRPGSALTMSHSLYNIAYLYYSDKLKRGSRSGHELMVNVFKNFVGGESPARFTLGQRIRHAARKATKKQKTAEERELSLSSQLSKLLQQEDFREHANAQVTRNEEIEMRSFRIASKLVNELSYTFFRKLIQKFSEGNILDCLQAVSALGPIALGVAPYVVAFKHHTRDRPLMREAALRFLGKPPPDLPDQKRAWFTDTLQDVNGVSHTIHQICEVARRNERDIQVITSKSKVEPTDLPLRNFAPVGEFELKEYEGLVLTFPPVLDILEHCWREKFSEIVISTPGPVGLMGLLAARVLGLKASGIYHTDFPEYVRVLTNDEKMGALTWKFMEWFYGALDQVYVRSGAYETLLLDRGFPAEKIKIMPHGVDCTTFNPDKRDPRFWEMFGSDGQVKFLYVGRVSREKDLETLVEAFVRLHREHPRTLLSVVGDGPYLPDLKKQLPKGSAIFTGFLSGEALARAYASADVFVFPSTTDTFGNVVLEAQASGLPAIVADTGGPRELIEHGVTGLVTQSKNAQSLFDAMRQLAVDASLRRRMSATARQRMSERTWERAFNDFWGKI